MLKIILSIDISFVDIDISFFYWLEPQDSIMIITIDTSDVTQEGYFVGYVLTKM